MTTRCAVLGSPIGHSLSPVLHRAAYAELGLDDWTYDGVVVDAAGLADVPRRPRRRLARAVADDAAQARRDPAASTRSTTWTRLSGVANTVLLGDERRLGFNTDIPGAMAALVERTSRAARVGRGAGRRSHGDLGAARARRARLHQRPRCWCATRAAPRRPWPSSPPTRARRRSSVRPLGEVGGARRRTSWSRPSRREAQTPELLAACAAVPAVFDVVYDPWPTPFARAAQDSGRDLVAGLDLLAHQAVLQVQLMTGQSVQRRPAPRRRSRRAGAPGCAERPSPRLIRLAFAHALGPRPPDRLALAWRVVCGALGALAAPAGRPAPGTGAATSPRRSRRREEVDSDEQQLFTRGCRRRRPRSCTSTSPRVPRLAADARAVVRAWSGRPSGWRWAGPARWSTWCRSRRSAWSLLVIDWRTTLLPTRIIHPTYVAARGADPAGRADRPGPVLALPGRLGLAGHRRLVLVFWWLFTAWGFGDVRLSRVLGPALGYLGWSEMLMGLALMVFVGGIGGVVLAIAHRRPATTLPLRAVHAGRGAAGGAGRSRSSPRGLGY